MTRIALIAALFLALFPTAGFAQGAQPAGSMEVVTWYAVSYAKFKPGMADEARRIIYEHFWPVDKEIGREVIPFDHVTGEWDHVVFIPMDGGPADLAFEQTPAGRRWQEAFFRREGGTDKAEALVRRLNDMVLHEKRELVKKRLR